MREIKFRGKRIDNGEWVYGDLLRGRDGKVYIDTSLNEVDPKTVGQYTGYNRNGIEIYEGDILQGEEIGEFGTVLRKWNGEVVWDNCGFYVKDDDSINRFNALGDYWFDEVIGNIYDNPELLK